MVVCYTMNPQHLTFDKASSHRIVYQGQWGMDCFTYEGTSVTGLTEKGKEVLQVYPDMVIPSQTPDGEDVTEIAAYAFEGYGIRSVILPDHLQKIGEAAFAGNALTKVTLPDTVVEIAENAFAGNGEDVVLVVHNEETYELLKNIQLEGAKIVYEEITEPEDPEGGADANTGKDTVEKNQLSSTEKTNRAAKTGDEQTAVLWIILMCGALFTCLIVQKRKIK